MFFFVGPETQPNLESILEYTEDSSVPMRASSSPRASTTISCSWICESMAAARQQDSLASGPNSGNLAEELHGTGKSSGLKSARVSRTLFIFWRSSAPGEYSPCSFRPAAKCTTTSRPRCNAETEHPDVPSGISPWARSVISPGMVAADPYFIARMIASRILRVSATSSSMIARATQFSGVISARIS